MLAHYFYNLLMIVGNRLAKRHVLLLIAITYPVFLLLLPPTRADFPYYEAGYLATFFDPTAPLFFRSASTLTAEAGWFAYTGIFRLFLPDFRLFLVANFFISLFVLVRGLRKVGFDADTVATMVTMMVPVIFPTLMFWSPRSSISFALCVLAVGYMSNREFARGLASAFCCVMIHSQFIPILVSSTVYFALGRREWFAEKFNAQGAGWRAFLIPAGVMALSVGAAFILPYLTFLPTHALMTSKLTILSRADHGFRASGLLSVFVYPAYMWINRREEQAKRSYFVLLLFTTFSLLLNVVFFDTPTVAGRLSRASDYVLFSYVIGNLRRVSPGGTFLQIAFFALFPFLFADLYSLDTFEPAVK